MQPEITTPRTGPAVARDQTTGHIALDLNAYFILARSLICAELKTRRNACDIFGDELLLTPRDNLAQKPLALSPGERNDLGARTARFFGLPVAAAAQLAALSSLAQWAAFLVRTVGTRPESITFSTSGSTGEPKCIARDYFCLEQDALHLAGMLDAPQRVVGLVPPHHIYGFIHTVLIPAVLQLPRVDLRFQPPGAIVSRLCPGDVVMGFPQIWGQCAKSGLRFPPKVWGMTSTGPCPGEVIRALQGLGLETMIEIYGSSENGAMAYRFDPDHPLSLMPTWKRAGNNRFARKLENGGQSKPVGFQDELIWVDATRFFVKKRLDNAVQVAGINVYPARVREMLLDHPGVVDCAVRLMRPEEGPRLKAFVVLAHGWEPGPRMREMLRTHLTARLTRMEQPATITFGAELPRNEMGKPGDWDSAV